MVAQLNKLTATSKVGLKPSEGRACKTKTVLKSVKYEAYKVYLLSKLCKVRQKYLFC